jgi:hypothetical protein
VLDWLSWKAMEEGWIETINRMKTSAVHLQEEVKYEKRVLSKIRMKID